MLKKIDRLVDWHGSKQWLVVMILSSTIGGICVNWGLTSYAWFIDGGPKLWVLMFVTAFLVIMLVFTILGKLTASRNLENVKADVERRRLLESSVFNPLETTFENKVLRFNDLYNHYDRVLADKVFKNCTFIGPGAFAFMGNYTDRNGQYHDLTLVSHKIPKAISSAVGFKDCKFINCRFYGWIFFMDNGQPSEIFIPMMEAAGNHEYIIRETDGSTLTNPS